MDRGRLRSLARFFIISKPIRRRRAGAGPVHPGGYNRMAMSWRIDGRGVLRWEPWERYSWLQHGFSTRAAGDFRDLPAEQVSQKFGAEGFGVVLLRQTHSSVVHAEPAASAAMPERLEGDALVGDRENRLLGVRTADCGALLLVDPRNRVAAAVHAGWRGAAARIVGKAVERLAADYRCDPGDLEALIGPCIGADRYEVGEEVAEQFDAGHLSRPEGAARPFLDLVSANRAQLIDAGLRPESVVAAGLCTYQREELFFSHRRDGAAAGRMLSVIGLSPVEAPPGSLSTIS